MIRTNQWESINLKNWSSKIRKQSIRKILKYNWQIKCKHLEIAEMKKDYEKIKYQSVPIKKQYKKRYQENPELYKKIKESGIINVKKRAKVVKAPIKIA